MIVLDENIIESQSLLLRSWRLAPRQIGKECGRTGMQDDEIIPLLHSLRQPTFFTRDLLFFSRDAPHQSFCIVALAVGQNEVASFVRRFLRFPTFDTHAKRLGKNVWISSAGLRVRQVNNPSVIQIAW